MAFAENTRFVENMRYSSSIFATFLFRNNENVYYRALLTKMPARKKVGPSGKTNIGLNRQNLLLMHLNSLKLQYANKTS